VLNKKAVEMGIKLGLAVKSRIHQRSIFERKNYFYPDLPKGYQITQNRYPLATDGFLKITLNQKPKKIALSQIHLEEDSGKSIHKKMHSSDEKTYLDFNRSGIPLLEIVTKPEINSPEEAVEFLKKLIIILQYLNICNGNMEEGSLRCDANISVQKKEAQQKSVRTEIKNLNSFRFLRKALEYEINRHIKNIKTGILTEPETKFWDDKKGKTILMRAKEKIQDYRFFPDPDLPPLVITERDIHKIKTSLPESPDEKINRFIKQYKIPFHEAKSLVSSHEISDYFEKTAKYSHEPIETSHWILRDVFSYLKKTHTCISEFPISSKKCADLIKHIKENKISRQTGKEIIFPEMISTGKKASDIIKEKSLDRISDKDLLKKIIIEILNSNKDQVSQYVDGKKQVFKYLVGQVMKKTRGKADPKMTNKLLLKILDRYNIKEKEPEDKKSIQDKND